MRATGKAGARAALVALAAPFALVTTVTGRSSAADSSPPPQPTLAPDARIDFSETPPEGKTTEESTAKVDYNAPPPSRPRKKGFVLESTIGALGFIGEFRHVAPTAFWLRTQFGYEFFSWLMLFASGELAFTDTSEASDPSHSRAFPLYAFGGGLRGTLHLGERIGIYLSGDVGAMTADIPKGSLAIFGFKNVEALNPYFGGHVGFEWYQIDRHLALTLAAGVRDALGFSRSGTNAAPPLLWDGGVALRYTF